MCRWSASLALLTSILVATSALHCGSAALDASDEGDPGPGDNADGAPDDVAPIPDASDAPDDVEQSGDAADASDDGGPFDAGPSWSTTFTFVASSGAKNARLSLTGPTPLVKTGYPLSAPTCTPVDGAVTCSIVVKDRKPGSYVANLDIEDDAANPHVLASSREVPVVVPDEDVTIMLTPIGFPTNLAIAPSSPVNTLDDGNGGLRLVGPLARDLEVTVFDATGSIIPAASAPTFTVATAGTYLTTAGAPTSANPSRFSLTPPSTWPRGSTGTLKVSASFAGPRPDGGTVIDACATPGSICSKQISIRPRELMAITDVSSPVVDLYDIAGATPMSLGSVTLAGATRVWTAAFDVDGNLYLSDGDQSSVVAIYDAPNYTFRRSISNLAYVSAAVVSPDKTNLYTLSNIPGRVVATPLSTYVPGTPLSIGNQLTTAVLSLDAKTLLFTDLGSNAVQRYDTDTKTLRSAAALPNGCAPTGLARSADGAYVFAACGGNETVQVVRVSDGVVTGSIPALSDPYGVAYDARNGVVCTAAQTTHRVVLLNDTHDGKVTARATVGLPASVQLMAADANGVCYAASQSSDTVYSVDVATGTRGPTIVKNGAYYLAILP